MTRGWVTAVAAGLAAGGVATVADAARTPMAPWDGMLPSHLPDGCALALLVTWIVLAVPPILRGTMGMRAVAALLGQQGCVALTGAFLLLHRIPLTRDASGAAKLASTYAVAICLLVALEVAKRDATPGETVDGTMP